MPTIPKMSWKYCKSPKFDFLIFFLIFIYFWQTTIIFKTSTFCHTLRTENIWPGCLTISLVQSIKEGSSVRPTAG